MSDFQRQLDNAFNQVKTYLQREWRHKIAVGVQLASALVYCDLGRTECERSGRHPLFYPTLRERLENWAYSKQEELNARTRPRNVTRERMQRVRKRVGSIGRGIDRDRQLPPSDR
jgi:hypothetical protein